MSRSSDRQFSPTAPPPPYHSLGHSERTPMLQPHDRMDAELRRARRELELLRIRAEIASMRANLAESSTSPARPANPLLSNVLRALPKLSSCFWFSATNKRNATAASVAGILFFVGWWLIIDASTAHGGGDKFTAGNIYGILGTISFIIVNKADRPSSSAGIRMLRLFFGFVLGFFSIIAATWMMIVDFSVIDKKASRWPGVALLLQNIFIFFGSLLYKIGRQEEEEDSDDE